jgi:transcription antitermination factor NusG
MSNPTKRWYALFTRTGYEKKVANLLSRRNVENYCPLKLQFNGRKKLLSIPLFNSFVFVNIDENEMHDMRGLDGVVNFVYWLGKPAIITNEEIEIMKRFMNEYTDVKLEKIPFGLDGIPRVSGGQITDKRVHLISVKNNTVKILLPSLGYNILAESVNTNVEVIISAKQAYNMDGKYKYAI